MRIRTRLMTGALMPLVLLVLIGFTMLYTDRQVRKVEETDRKAVQVRLKVFFLNSAVHYYLLRHEEVARNQIQTVDKSLTALLSGMASKDPYEQDIIQSLRSNHEAVRSLLARMEILEGRAGRASPSSLDLKGRLTGYVLERTREMAADTVRFEYLMSTKLASAHRRANIFIFGFTALLSVIMLVVSFFTSERISKTLHRLTRGTRIIAAGDLDFSIPVAGHDELAQLSEAFNRMALKLKESYAAETREAEARRESEEALRQHAELIDLSHEAIIAREPDGTITFWNRGAEETYGWTKAEARGKMSHDLLKTLWPVSFDDHLAILKRDARWEGELVHTRKDGTTLTVLSRHVLRPDERGNGQAVMEINIDITERKRAEEAVKAHAAQLEASNRELKEFAFVASHDLQEPLRKIQAFGDQLKLSSAGRLDSESLDFLERMRNAATRMQALIQALLGYSRVTTRARPFVGTDLGAVAREAAGNLEAAIAETGGRVEIEDLGTIDADPVQMGQLFQNLIGNGLKFHGDRRPSVKVYGSPEGAEEGDRPDGKYRIYVEDNGIGFDVKYLDRIFTPFQRLHGRGVYEGTGIGLAVCRKIVDRHGGTITAESTIGKGSVFIVILPVKQPKTGEGAAE